MAASLKHALTQGPVLRALGSAALTSLRRGSGASQSQVTLPGPLLRQELPPRSPELIADYVRHVGGDPTWYRGRVPAHLFPQWGFPLAVQAMAGLPYPLARVMNAGCRIEQRAPLPAKEPLLIQAQLSTIDDDGRRALITTSVITGTQSAPEAVVAEIRAFVPLAKPGGGKGAKTGKAGKSGEHHGVPLDAKEIAALRIPARAGLDFAMLTGDFNPIHWVAPYARASGFKRCILHGFSTLARGLEAMNRSLFAGSPSQLKTVEVRFSRPMLLPAAPCVFVKGDKLWIADAPGAGPYLEGTWS